MSYQVKVIVLGAFTVIAFDVITSILSVHYGFPYADPVGLLGSSVIYALAGLFAARAGSLRTVLRAGAVMGLVDATAGWTVSWFIGPGRVPSLTPARWIVIAGIVTLIGAVCGAVGGIGGRLLPCHTRLEGSIRQPSD